MRDILEELKNDSPYNFEQIEKLDDLFSCLCGYSHYSIGQQRENGEPYYFHPYRCAERINHLANKIKNDNDLLIFCAYAKAVAYLHDVIEDTGITLEELMHAIKKEMYEIKLLSNIHLDLNILENSLKVITHDKRIAYDEYIDIVLEDKIASFVKMIDLEDNLRIFDLITFDDKKFLRAQNYVKYIKKINNKWMFIERFNVSTLIK